MNQEELSKREAVVFGCLVDGRSGNGGPEELAKEIISQLFHAGHLRATPTDPVPLTIDRRMEILEAAIASHGPAAGEESDRCFTARAKVFETYLRGEEL